MKEESDLAINVEVVTPVKRPWVAPCVIVASVDDDTENSAGAGGDSALSVS